MKTAITAVQIPHEVANWEENPPVKLFDYFRRRAERESAIPDQDLAPVEAPSPDSSADESIAAALREASSGGRQSIPGAIHDAFGYARAAKTGGVVEGVDHGKLRQLQTSVLAIMKEHGIDPQRPDPGRFTDPEVQRALQDAVLRHGFDASR
jgi:hypothetical protein